MRHFGWTVVILGALLAGCGGDDEGDARAATPRARPGDAREAVASGDRAQVVEVGAELYVQGCIMCHGEGGQGTALGPSLVDTQRRHLFQGSVEEVTRIVADGVPEPEEFPVPMPDRGDGTFTDEQVQAVATYVASLSQP